LEIGIFDGRTFEAVAAANRVGVDPDPRFESRQMMASSRVYRTCSDPFFAAFGSRRTFDGVLVDGLHHFEQALRDLLNSLLILREGGFVLVDDTVPCDPTSAIRDREESKRQRMELGLPGQPWHGDVWKILPYLSASDLAVDWRTISSGSNCQTLVWCNETPDRALRVDDRLAQSVNRLSFQEIFGAETTFRVMFRPCSEDDAIKTWASWRKSLK